MSTFAEEIRNGFLISTDQKKMDIAFIHKYLNEESYWAKGVPIEIVKKSIENSLCFAAYDNGKQIAFARVISDYTTFAYLADVFVTDKFRGQGVSRMMMDLIMKHPDLQDLRRFCLGTRDAHSLYQKYGFKVIDKPELFMEIKKQNIYLDENS